MTNLSSRYLTHKQAGISGCTLFETVIVTLAFQTVVIGSAILIGFIFGYGLLCVLGLFILSLPCIKYFLRWMGKQKEGKPHGVFIIRFRKKMAHLGLWRSPFLEAEGRLQTRKKL